MDSLRDMRRRVGLSQADLSALVGVHQSAVAQWENGIYFPRRNHIEALARILNTDEDAVLNGVTESRKESWRYHRYREARKNWKNAKSQA